MSSSDSELSDSDIEVIHGKFINRITTINCLIFSCKKPLQRVN